MSFFKRGSSNHNRFDHNNVGGNVNLVQGNGSIKVEATDHTVNYQKLAQELQSLCQRSDISDADYRAFSETAAAVREQNESAICSKIKQFAVSFSQNFFIQFSSTALAAFIQARLKR